MAEQWKFVWNVIVMPLKSRYDRRLSNGCKKVFEKCYAISDTYQGSRVANAVHLGFERGYTLEA